MIGFCFCGVKTERSTNITTTGQNNFFKKKKEVQWHFLAIKNSDYSKGKSALPVKPFF